MLSDGWEILAHAPHSGNSRGFQPFTKRDTITVSFRRASYQLDTGHVVGLNTPSAAQN
jgi:hypothetical protein